VSDSVRRRNSTAKWKLPQYHSLTAFSVISKSKIVANVFHLLKH
jgi:hypothetical protein